VLENKKEIIKQYIRNNPNCTYRDIKKDTKIKIERIYKNMGEAYKHAKVELSKNLIKRTKKEQKKDVLEFIKKNPSCTVTQIHNQIKVNVSRVFGSITEAYKLAGIKYPKREIKDGVMNPEVIKRSKEFENKCIEILRNFGDVKSKIRTSVGIIDCLFNYKNREYVVEIKDYRGKNNITNHEIKQLLRYMESLNCNEGLLICPEESLPKRKNSRNIYIDGKTIQILPYEDLRGRSIKDF